MTNTIKMKIKKLLSKASYYLPHSIKLQILKSLTMRKILNYLTIQSYNINKNILDEVSRKFYISNIKPSSVDGSIKFSIILPTYNTPPHLLRRCIDTVLNQTWKNWQLCIVDDASTNITVREILNEYKNFDNRITVNFASKNQGIAGASQAGLAISNGDYIALLDHDDELTVNALECMAIHINENPDASAFYSDECKISPEGKPVEIFAKPDWSPSLMINSMYMGHLTVYKRELVNRVGGFRSEFDFSQDYDLALRVIDSGAIIVHVPEVLYGWRMIPQSAADGGKPYARLSNIAALQAAIDRRGWRATAIAGASANIIKWHEPREKPKLSLIIPSDNSTMIKDAIRSITEFSTYPNYEIIVVTNSRVIEELSYFEIDKNIRYFTYDKPFNFSDKCNAGASLASGEVLIFYNDDVRVITREWMEHTLDAFNLHNVGAVGVKLLYENDTIQHAGMVTGVRRLVGTAFHTWPDNSPSYFNFAQSVREVSLLCGALIAVKRSVFDDIKGFDAINTPVYHSDVDLCFKVREKGLSCVYTPHAKLLHIGHVSIGKDERKEKKIKKDKAGVWMLKRWAKEISYDPYFPTLMRNICYHDSPEPYTVFPGQISTERTAGDVLLASHDLSSSGAPRVVLEMAKTLKKAGWFVVVIAPTDGAMRSEFEKLGVSVIIEPLLYTQHISVLDFAKDYDLIICNTIVSLPLATQMNNIVPTVLYIHEISLVDELSNNSDKFATELCALQNVWAGSPLCLENLKKYRSNNDLLEYGLDEVSPPTKITINDNVINLAVFGSIEPRKGQDLIAEAFTNLPEETTKNVVLHFYGRVIDTHMHKNLIRKYNNNNKIIFEGELDYESYLMELSNTDMVIVPSRSDTLPLVSLNALAAGIPILCTKQTGTSHYLNHEQSGFIVNNADVHELTNALTNALNKKQLWSEIGLEGKKIFLKHFSQNAFQLRLSEKAQKLAKL